MNHGNPGSHQVSPVVLKVWSLLPPGNLPEKHILRLHFRSTDSEALGWSPAIGLKPTGDCAAG